MTQQRQKILIVDDRPENLLALRKVLADVDVEMVAATNGNDALAATLDHDFALAILDVAMPGMDGYELAGLLRGDSRTRRLPIIFVTAAYGEEAQIFKGYEVGAVDYLVKPYDPRVLLSKVGVFLELHRMNTELADKVMALATSEERYRCLVGTVPDIVYRIDRDGTFTFLNHAVRHLGYTPEELIGRHFSEIILPADLTSVSRQAVLPGYTGSKTEKAATPGLFDERRTGARITAGLEVRLVPRQGGKVIVGEVLSTGEEFIIVEVSSSGLYGVTAESGKNTMFLGSVGVIRDISERKRNEEELRCYREHLEDLVRERTAELAATNQSLHEEVVVRQRSEKFASGILEGMSEGLLVLDRDYRIAMANQVYADLVGKPIAELRGRHCYEVLHQLERPCHLVKDQFPCPMHEVLANGELHTMLREYDDSKGVRRALEIKAYPLRDNEGRVISVIKIVSDITERLQMETQLRQAQKMEAIGTLAGGIAHDFNNILTAILGYAEIAKMELEVETRAHLDIAEVITAGKRAKELVKQILTFCRKGEQELHPLRLQFVLKEALKLLRSSIPTTIEIRQYIDTDCGSVMADPTQIHQVIMNLCTNAYHAMRETGGTLTVSLSQFDPRRGVLAEKVELEPRPYVVLTVSDSGCGIPTEHLERIFDPYFTTKKKGEGTGLGLAVVHGIVHGHDGQISVESPPEKGTTFRVYLPVLEDNGLAEEGKVENDLPRGNERILLVDDDVNIVRIVQRTLNDLGYRITTFTDSEVALGGFLRQPEAFDLVISDMTMPCINGAELARYMLDTRPEIPILLCTGYSELITKEKALEMGIKGFAMKPVSRAELALLVRQTLDQQGNSCEGH